MDPVIPSALRDYLQTRVRRYGRLCFCEGFFLGLAAGTILGTVIGFAPQLVK